MSHAVLMVLATAAFLVGFFGFSWHEVEGRADAAVVRAQMAELRRDSVRVDTLVKRATARKTIRETGTLVRDSVVCVPRDAADSTIAACLVTLASCDAQVANAEKRATLHRTGWAAGEHSAASRAPPCSRRAARVGARRTRHRPSTFAVIGSALDICGGIRECPRLCSWVRHRGP